MKSIDLIKLTQDLIRCASVTPADEGAQETLKKPLRDMGFEIFDLPFEGNGGSYPVKNFFARLGTGAPHICYGGHTDVVPAGDEAAWAHPSFEAAIQDGIMYGRGTVDMKGGNTAFVTAISRFLETNPDFKGSISLLITGDEEAESINGTQRVLEWMKENNHIPDITLVGEPTNSDAIGDTVKIGRRGYTGGFITVHGVKGHVAYPQLALNPLPHLAKLIHEINNVVLDEGNEHFEPSNLEFVNIEGGAGASNVIPDKAVVKFGIRYNNIHTPETLEKIIQDKINELTNGTDYKVDLAMKSRSSSNAFITETNETVDMFCDCITDVTGHKPALSTGGGTSDARFIKNYCPVFEFGLLNKTAHHTDEHISIEALETLVDIYTKFLQTYFKAA